MYIRTAEADDLDMISAVEAECFPPAEAATRAEFEERLKYYKDCFWLMFDGDRLIAFLDGFVTDEPDLTDEMYARADMHNENGRWQMIFGVNTLPEYRGRGYAGELINRAISDARAAGRSGVVLTCKRGLLEYYARFGFVSEGPSEKSRHGGAEWYQMRLAFPLRTGEKDKRDGV
ncbi:MAG: GNAT family N-acetyltransferase [Clostridia bacterium]|nr:GNAT family N-acetyltransferase [Clostridia bacterium]